VSGHNGANHHRGDRGLPAGGGGDDVAVVAADVLIERDLAWVADSARRRGHGSAVLVRIARRMMLQWEREAFDELAARMR